MTVTEPITRNLTLDWRFIRNSCLIFHKNMTSGLVADTGTQTEWDGQMNAGMDTFSKQGIILSDL